tara:strand:+ start:697 stop:1515 length:819 start_codon:yes stop_codon:yes gene_type:complete
MTTKLGLIGNGFVGGAARQLACEKTEVYVYDIDADKCVPKGTTIDDVALCDIVFVAVPTPATKDGSCFLGIVESVVDELKKSNPECSIVIRSTCPPGTAERLGCMFMPEFLTESNANEDFCANPLWILGGESSEVLQRVLTNAKESGCIASDELLQMPSKEAELVKYVRNCFLATKVSFFNEVCSFCEKNGLDYESVRIGATRDKRIGSGHSRVPGPDGRRGFGGICFPKDVAAWCDFANAEYSIVRAAHERNRNVDRSDRDWEKDKGRAVV